MRRRKIISSEKDDASIDTMIHVDDDSAHSSSTQPIYFRSSSTSLSPAKERRASLPGRKRVRNQSCRSDRLYTNQEGTTEESTPVDHEEREEEDEDWLHMKVLKEMAPSSRPTPPMNSPGAAERLPMHNLRPSEMTPVDPLQTTPPHDMFSSNSRIPRQDDMGFHLPRNSMLCVDDVQEKDRTPPLSIKGMPRVCDTETQPLLSFNGPLEDSGPITDPLAPSTQMIRNVTARGHASGIELTSPAKGDPKDTSRNKRAGAKRDRSTAQQERKVTKFQENGHGKGKRRSAANNGVILSGSRCSGKLRNSPRGRTSDSAPSSPFRFVILPWVNDTVIDAIDGEEDLVDNDEFHLLCDLVKQLDIPLCVWKQDPFTQRMVLHPTSTSSSPYPTHIFVHPSVTCWSASMLWACALGIPIISTNYLYDLLTDATSDTAESRRVSTKSFQESPSKKQGVKLPPIQLTEQHIHPLIFSHIRTLVKESEEENISQVHSGVYTEKTVTPKKPGKEPEGHHLYNLPHVASSSPPRLTAQLQRGYLDELIPAGQQSERPYYQPLFLGVTIGLLQAYRDQQGLPSNEVKDGGSDRNGVASPLNRTQSDQLVRMAKEIIRVLGGNPVSLGREWDDQHVPNGMAERGEKGRHLLLAPRVDVVMDCSRILTVISNTQENSDMRRSPFSLFWEVLSIEMQSIGVHGTQTEERISERLNDRTVSTEGPETSLGTVPLVPFSWLAHCILQSRVQMLQQTDLPSAREYYLNGSGSCSPFSTVLSSRRLRSFALSYYRASSETTNSDEKKSPCLKENTSLVCERSPTAPSPTYPPLARDTLTSSAVCVLEAPPQENSQVSSLPPRPTTTLNSEAHRYADASGTTKVDTKPMSPSHFLLRVTSNHNHGGTLLGLAPPSTLILELLSMKDLRIKTSPGPHGAVKTPMEAARYPEFLGDDGADYHAHSDQLIVRRDSIESDSIYESDVQNRAGCNQQGFLSNRASQDGSGLSPVRHSPEGQVLLDSSLPNGCAFFSRSPNPSSPHQQIRDVTNTTYRVGGKVLSYNALRHGMGVEEDEDEIVVY